MKLDDELIQKLVEQLKTGAPIDTACDFVEINRSSFYRWKQEATQIYDEVSTGKRKPSKLTPRQKNLVKFLKQILHAIASYELDLLREIREGDKGWQALAWILERRFRERYARRVLVDDEAYVKEFERRFGAEFRVMLQLLLDTAEAVLESKYTYDEAPLEGKKLQKAAGVATEQTKN